MTSPLAFGLGDALVEAVDVAHAELRHLLVALLHLAHRPFQRDDRLLRVGDDGREEMRDAVVDRELQHLRVDHDEPALLRRQPVEQRQDHGVDGDRLARAGGAGDEQMRHAGEVGDDRLAADGLAEAERELVLRALEVLARQQLAQVDGLALGVRQLDADGVAALHDGDAGRDRAHRAGDVVGERDHARRLDAGRRLELVERDDRAGADVDDLAADAEILEHAFEQRGVLLERVGRRPSATGGFFGSASSVQRRQLVSRSPSRSDGCASARRACRASARRRRRATRGRDGFAGALVVLPSSSATGASKSRVARPRSRLVAGAGCAARGRGRRRRAAAARAAVARRAPRASRRGRWRAGCQRPVRERRRATSRMPPAGLVVVGLVVVVLARRGRRSRSARRPCAPSATAEAAGGRDGEDGDAREDEADQRRAGAARRRRARSSRRRGARRRRRRRARSAAASGRSPAARSRPPSRRPTPPIHSASAQRAGGAAVRERTSCQPQTASGAGAATDAEPEELHREVGDDRARQRRAGCATGGVGGVVEARIVDRPGRERRRDDAAQRRSAPSPPSSAAPALEEGPDGLGEIS